MSDSLTLNNVGATRGNRAGFRSRGIAPLDVVHLYAHPLWLKDDRIAVATLTPRQARVLAVELLAVAERVEDNPSGEVE